jgi:hypothetical protein
VLRISWWQLLHKISHGIFTLKKECHILKYDAHTTVSIEKLTYHKNVPEKSNLLFFKLNAYEIYDVVRK